LGTSQAPVDPVARQRARAVIWVAAYLWDNVLAGGEAGRAAFTA